jgi:crotonobetainyl-CoA:carnitine CoA-transferase CaiB-like acyl-CoA transferase
MSRFGGNSTPEEHAHIGTLDVNCGFAAGMAMGLALFHKLRTTEVTTARTSLAAVTNLAQLPFAFDYPTKPACNEPGGRGCLGYHALSHFYQCAQGWLFLDSDINEIALLASIEGLSELEQCDDINDIKAYLEEAFKQKNASDWALLLQNAGIAAANAQSIVQLRERYARIADGTVDLTSGSYAFSTDVNHPSGHDVTRIDHYSIRPTQAKIKAVSASEKFGQSSREILTELGYPIDQINSLITNNIVATRWGTEYLPS